MHELSIALAILDAAVEEAARRRAISPGERPVAVHVRVGALSGVVADSLQAAFELARDGSGLEGCRLEIHEVPIECRCLCSAIDQPVTSAQDLVCSRCGRPAIEIVRGRELEVSALEVIDEPCYANG